MLQLGVSELLYSLVTVSTVYKKDVREFVFQIRCLSRFASQLPLEELVGKPLKRFYKIENALNPELKHGENESFARGLLALQLRT